MNLHLTQKWSSDTRCPDRRFGPARMHDIVNFFRRNPQALALLLIVLVLGIGTFIAVLIAVGSSSSRTGPGYPSGTLPLPPRRYRRLTGPA